MNFHVIFHKIIYSNLLFYTVVMLCNAWDPVVTKVLILLE